MHRNKLLTRIIWSQTVSEVWRLITGVSLCFLLSKLQCERCNFTPTQGTTHTHGHCQQSAWIRPHVLPSRTHAAQMLTLHTRSGAGEEGRQRALKPRRNKSRYRWMQSSGWRKVCVWWGKAGVIVSGHNHGHTPTYGQLRETGWQTQWETDLTSCN